MEFCLVFINFILVLGLWTNLDVAILVSIVPACQNSLYHMSVAWDISSPDGAQSIEHIYGITQKPFYSNKSRPFCKTLLLIHFIFSYSKMKSNIFLNSLMEQLVSLVRTSVTVSSSNSPRSQIFFRNWNICSPDLHESLLFEPLEILVQGCNNLTSHEHHIIQHKLKIDHSSLLGNFKLTHLEKNFILKYFSTRKVSNKSPGFDSINQL